MLAVVMSKIRGDPKQIALAHPTRAAMYNILRAKEEMATVELEKEIKVTRYHLYHHLKQLKGNRGISITLDGIKSNRDVPITFNWD